MMTLRQAQEIYAMCKRTINTNFVWIENAKVAQMATDTLKYLRSREDIQDIKWLYEEQNML